MPTRQSGTETLAPRCVVVDPGHGGRAIAGSSTPLGVRGPRGTLEKQVTLDLARRVAVHLGSAAVLTRTGDDNLTLDERSAVARRHGARVFVSLHANGGPPGKRGAEAYVHERAGAESRALAEALRSELATYGNVTHEITQAEMGVLDPTRLAGRTAACLLEVDYLSDPHGEERLRDVLALDKLGRAIAGGIRRYMGGAAASAVVESRAQAVDFSEWKTRLSTLIPNDYARDMHNLELLHYVTFAIEAIHMVMGIAESWAPVAAVAAEVEVGLLEKAVEGLLVGVEAALTVVAPLAAMIGNFVQLGMGYAKAAEVVAERWGTKGFAVGVIWVAADIAVTNFRQTRLWIPVGLPDPTAFTVDNIKMIALRSYQMGVVAGMAAARELSPTQKSNLFQDLRNRDEHRLVDWRQFDNGSGSASFIEDAAIVFRANHLPKSD